MKNIIQTVKDKLAFGVETGTFPIHSEIEQINRCLLILSRAEHKRLSYVNALTLNKSVGFIFDQVGVIPTNGDHTKPSVGPVNDSNVLVRAQQLSAPAQRIYSKIYEFANDVSHVRSVNPERINQLVDPEEMVFVGRLLDSASVSRFKKVEGPHGNDILRTGRFAIDEPVSLFSRPSKIYIFDEAGGNQEVPVKSSICRDLLKSISSNASTQVLQEIESKNNKMTLSR